jgi:hypothetical protein
MRERWVSALGMAAEAIGVGEGKSDISRVGIGGHEERSPRKPSRHGIGAADGR